MLQIPPNIMFISGMHGSGKDTLIEDLLNDKSKNDCEIIRYKKCELTSFEDIYERQMRRLAKYSIDLYRVIKLALYNPYKMIITDRCIIDAFVYLKTFKDIKWLNTEEYDYLMNVTDSMFNKWSYYAFKPFVLFPTYEFILENLKKRQQTHTKWRETDLTYARAIYDSYYQLCVKYEDKDDPKYSLEVCTIEDREERLAYLKKCINLRYAAYISNSRILDDMQHHKDYFHFAIY